MHWAMLATISSLAPMHNGVNSSQSNAVVCAKKVFHIELFVSVMDGDAVNRTVLKLSLII